MPAWRLTAWVLLVALVGVTCARGERHARAGRGRRSGRVPAL